MAVIEDIKARQILDSRGNPTIEVDVRLKEEGFGRFIVPSGASTGSREALELRDGDPNQYQGKGVLKAIQNVLGPIANLCVGQNWASQKDLDEALIKLDGSPNKSRLGANAILGVSVAFAKAVACASQKPFYEFLNRDAHRLPMPLINVINGGAHAQNGLDIQEFMIVPWSAQTFKEALAMSAAHFHCLKETLHQKGLCTAVGDEGGFAPELDDNRQALELLSESALKAGLNPGREVVFALDVAATEFYEPDAKRYLMDNKHYDAGQFIDYLENLTKDFPIVSLEDPLAENDILGFQTIAKHLGGTCQIVGDDLFVTDPHLVQEGIREHWANAVLVKLNQIGTLSETLETIEEAKKARWGFIISHRSGDTEDTTIADLAVGTDAPQIKTGSLSRSERVAKYNRLLRIEEELGTRARFVGKDAFRFG